MHGVKTPHDLLYRERFEGWREHPRTQVLLTTDEADRTWHDRIGVVTELFDELTVDPVDDRHDVRPRGHDARRRPPARRQGRLRGALSSVASSATCSAAIGLCGHCQFGADFACKDGPVFPLRRVKPLSGGEGAMKNPAWR